MHEERRPLSVVVVGAGGFGRRHLETVAALERQGMVRLTGIVEPRPARDDDALRAILARGTDLAASAEAWLAEHPVPDVVTIASPPHFHAAQTVLFLRSGSAVWLEKPPTTNLADFDRMTDLARETGKPVQVDFMWHALPQTRQAGDLLRSGRIGRIRKVTAVAAGPRPDSYYRRNNWAGRERLEDGTPVHDGPLTNAFAHVLDMALHLAGGGQPRRAALARSVRAERYRARPISGDDFACARARLEGNVELTIAVAHCVERSIPCEIRVDGERGILYWTPSDPVRIVQGKNEEILPAAEPGDPYVRMFRNLCETVRNPEAGEPVWPLESTRAWMRFTEAVRASCPVARAIPPDEVDRVGEDRVYAVRGIDGILETIRAAGRLPSEQGVPWAESTREIAL